MADGLSTTGANDALGVLKTNYTWVKLHTASPGSAATTAPATETTRKQVTWTTPSGGSMASVTTDLVWTSVAGTEDFTDFSVWSASTAGTFGFSGTITANPVTAGDTFTIPAGSLTASLTTAS